jgi:hypothetical protein
MFQLVGGYFLFASYYIKMVHAATNYWKTNQNVASSIKTTTTKIR